MLASAILQRILNETLLAAVPESVGLFLFGGSLIAAAFALRRVLKANDDKKAGK